jgi:hypothetical protein
MRAAAGAVVRAGSGAAAATIRTPCPTTPWAGRSGRPPPPPHSQPASGTDTILGVQLYLFFGQGINLKPTGILTRSLSDKFYKNYASINMDSLNLSLRRIFYRSCFLISYFFCYGSRQRYTGTVDPKRTLCYLFLLFRTLNY